MQTILISDIDTKKDSIIPYGLNFIKFIDDRVKIIHLIDSRSHQAVSSAFADSQSFEVSNKLSFSEIIEREKHQAKLALDKLLSREASRLNFPLKVNTIIEENSIEKLLSSENENGEKRLIISSSQFKGTIIDDIDEFLSINRKFNFMSLVIPPGHHFKFPEKVFVYHDFKKRRSGKIN